MRKLSSTRVRTAQLKQGGVALALDGVVDDDKKSNSNAALKLCLDDVLGFLSTRELLCGGLFRVSKEWQRVLSESPHVWGSSLDLSWARRAPTLPSMFAWHRVTVSAQLAVLGIVEWRTGAIMMHST